MNFYSPDVEIRKYDIEVRPYLYRLEISGKIEMVTPFLIPPQSLFGKLIFPNQNIRDIELVPYKGEYCISDYGRCGVFSFRSLVNLSGDKYFSREIKEYEKVPLKMTFDLNTQNWSIFKELNGLYDPHNYRYIRFIENLKRVELNNYIEYRNSFYLERGEFGRIHNILEVPLGWRLNRWNYSKKEFSKVITNLLHIELENHDHIRYLNQPIKKLFSISPPKYNYTNPQERYDISDLELTPEKTLLTLPKSKEIELAPPEKLRDGDGFSFWVSEGVMDRGGQYVTDPLNRGILLYEKSEGFFRHRVLVKLKKFSFYLNLKNHYSFEGNHIKGIPHGARVIVKHKSDSFFKKLSDFRSIEI